MLAKCVRFYESFRARIHGSEQPPEKETTDLQNKQVYPLSLHVEGLMNILSPETRIFLHDCDKFFPIVQNICTFLPIYHLAMIYVEMGAHTSSWRIAITKEIEKRINTFNWQAVFMNIRQYKCATDNRIPISHSKQLFGTRIESVLTFFAANVKHDVLYILPQIEYAQKKNLMNYLLNDVTLSYDIPTVCVSMDNLKMINNGIQASLYYSLYIPAMCDIRVMYFSEPREVSHVVAEDEHIESLLMFSSCNDPADDVCQLLNELEKSQTAFIPIAGSFCIDRIYKTNVPGDDVSQFIAFVRKKESKTPFYSASIVIRRRDKFESKVIEFKNNIKRHSEEFILSFICNGKRGKSQEARILEKHFSSCPIFQMEVNGEVGQDCYVRKDRDGAPLNVSKKLKRNGDDYVHAFTTVMIYISWGKAKTDL